MSTTPSSGLRLLPALPTRSQIRSIAKPDPIVFVDRKSHDTAVRTRKPSRHVSRDPPTRRTSIRHLNHNIKQRT
jgi:hypothetical protein